MKWKLTSTKIRKAVKGSMEAIQQEPAAQDSWETDGMLDGENGKIFHCSYDKHDQSISFVAVKPSTPHFWL